MTLRPKHALDERQQQLCTESRWDFSDLRALFINCTLKPSPEPSNTQGLADIAIAVTRAATSTSRTPSTADPDEIRDLAAREKACCALSASGSTTPGLRHRPRRSLSSVADMAASTTSNTPCP